MELVIAIGMGVGLGILQAEAEIPRMRLVPFFTASAVGLIAFFLDVARASNPLIVTLAFLASALVAGALYGGGLRKREALDPTATYWDWVVRTIVHSNYGRRLYKKSRRNLDTSVFP